MNNILLKTLEAQSANLKNPENKKRPLVLRLTFKWIQYEYENGEIK